MQIYEVASGLVRVGARLVLHPTAGIPMGRIETFPIGRSISSQLEHPDDDGVWMLKWGRLQRTTGGLKLVRQSKEAALREERALVLLDCIQYGKLQTRVTKARNHNPPALIYSGTEDDGVTRYLYVFRSNEGLFVTCPAIDEDLQRFTLVWTPEKGLEKGLCRSPRMPPVRRPQKQGVRAPVKSPKPQLLVGQA